MDELESNDETSAAEETAPTPDQIADAFERFKLDVHDLPAVEVGEIFVQFAQKLPWPDNIEAWQGAIEAFGRDPATAFDAAECAIVLGLSRLQHPEPDIAAAVEELTQGLLANPDVAEIIDDLLANRAPGDPTDNWRRRVEMHEQRLAHVAPEEDPATWATYNNARAIALSERPGIASTDTLRARAEAHRDSIEVLGNLVVDATVNSHRELSFALQFTMEQSDEERLTLQDEARHHANVALELSAAENITPDCRRMAQQQVVSLTATSESSTLRDVDQALVAITGAATSLGSAAGPMALADLAKSRLLLLKRQQDLSPDAKAKAHVAHDISTALDDALRNLTPDHLVERFTVRTVAAEGLVAVQRFDEGIELLGQALDDAHRLLAQAIQLDSRLESVRRVAQAARLKANAEILNGLPAEACATLERGRNQLLAQPGDADITGDDLHRAVPTDGALVQLCIASDPGWAIVVTEEKISAVELPDLPIEDLETLVQGPDMVRNGLGGWLLDYLSQDPDEPDTIEQLQTSIVELGKDLHARFWDPVNAALDNLAVPAGAELLLLHHGATVALPFHAAWTGSPDDPAWIVDRWAVRTSPSIRLSLPTDREPEAKVEPSVGMLADPRHELDLEDLEIFSVRRFGSQESSVAHGEDATAERLLEMLRTHDVVHVGAHGHHVPAQVFLSFFELAEKRNFMLGELATELGAAPVRPWLVVLSACDSGVPRSATHADEAMGFPTMLIEAGVDTVVGAAWMADEAATALVLDHFYSVLGSGCSPTVALNRAQRWLRSATADELRNLTRTLRKSEGGPRQAAGVLRRRLGSFANDDRPYRHPFHWAALTIHGGR